MFFDESDGFSAVLRERLAHGKRAGSAMLKGRPMASPFASGPVVRVQAS
jgi:hypothetical protein